MTKKNLNLSANLSTLDMELIPSSFRLIENIDSDSEGIFDQETSLELPDILRYDLMSQYPCVRFDRYLMLIEDEQVETVNDVELLEKQTPIPNFIAYLVLVIRKRFEEELKNRICFLESHLFPEHIKVLKLSRLIYANCDSLETVEDLTKNSDCTLLFCVLLEILQRFENKIFQFSRETNYFIEKEGISELLRSHEYIIVDHIIHTTNKIYAKRINPSVKKKNIETLSISNLGGIIQSYYDTKSLTKMERINWKNRFHTLLYRDLRLFEGNAQRYLFRFILKYCIYIIRRYVCVVSGRLRKLRKESWDVAHETIVPKVDIFARCRMASFLACTITEIKNEVDSVESRIRLLKYVFTVDMEKLWYRQMKISDIFIQKKSINSKK